jgi:hypothetical protein
MAEKQVHVCENPACTLGTPGSPGRFTGGATKEQVLAITGNPDGDHGDGVCPNCGERGEKFDPAKAAKTLLAEAKAQYDAQVAAIKEGVSRWRR